MKRVSAHLIAAMCTCAFAGCSGSSNDINAKLDEANKRIDVLGKKVEDLEFKAMIADDSKQWERTAYLTPGGEGYSVVHFDLGVLTVSLEDIKPYANGSKVTLRIGNTSAAIIDGLRAKMEWGAVDANGIPLKGTEKSRDISLMQSMRAGAWTRLTVVLEGVPPSELGFVRVHSVTHRGIKLFN